MEEIKHLVDEWLSLDKNETTRKEIQELYDAGNVDELKKRLCGRIEFGTAGLRGRMAAGYTCMNDLIILQTTQGLAKYMLKVNPSCQKQGVVLGYDARHNSKRFAQMAASVFLSQGFKVFLFNRFVPTPFVPFGILHLKCAAGVMVTASHNPKQDNGYKLYWENGAQIISPFDTDISESIMQNLVPWPEVVYPADVEGPAGMEIYTRTSSNGGCVVDVTCDIESAYYAAATQYCWNRESNPTSPLKIAYTAMHGVGARFVENMFKHYDLNAYIPTPEQVEADPEFPTVAFPNPEEGKGALALSMRTADANGCPIILANDPDADRLAVAEKNGSEWRIFSGNEIGLLLADWAWTNYKKHNPTADFSKVVMIASTVSSKVLKSMAQTEGFRFEETLTGFKWIGNKADEMQKKGYTFLFGYEVEIGFLVGSMSFDKDGVRTAAIFSEMSNSIYARGSTLCKHLEELYCRYGHFEMRTRYFFCYSPIKMKEIFDIIRKDGKYTWQVGGHKIASIRDLTEGFDNTQPDNKPTLPVSKASQMITFTFEDGSVCTFRASGTEPKLKYYFEVMSRESRAAAQAKCAELAETVIREFLRPDENGLVPPKD